MAGSGQPAGLNDCQAEPIARFEIIIAPIANLALQSSMRPALRLDAASEHMPKLTTRRIEGGRPLQSA
jgi:hypothetical protein